MCSDEARKNSAKYLPDKRKVDENKNHRQVFSLLSYPTQFFAAKI